MAEPQRCGTCRFLGGKGPRRKNWAYPCDFEVAVPALPDSVTSEYSFQRRAKIFPKALMGPFDGTSCPCYQRKEKAHG